MGTTVLSNTTLVVATKDRRTYVERLLAVVRHRPFLFVVDRGRRDLDLPENLHGATFLEVEPGLPIPKICELGIERATTRFICLICDDVDPGDGSWLSVAATHYEKVLGGADGAVALNDGHGGHDFLLFSKVFYMRECHPTPYSRYYQDTEIWQKAIKRNVAARAHQALLPHMIEGAGSPQNAAGMAKDTPVFQARMSDFGKRLYPISKDINPFFAIPIHEKIDPYFFGSMINFATQCQLPKRRLVVKAGESNVSRSRNQLTQEFLQTDCTDLVFIDCDETFQIEDVLRLLSHDKDIVCGCVCKKVSGAPDWVGNDLNPPVPTGRDGLKLIRYGGTGFMRIRRRVFELMIQHYPDLAYQADVTGRREFDFWTSGVFRNAEMPGGRFLSEDWFFCQRWNDIGGQVWLDTGIVIGHWGLARYPLQSYDLEEFKLRGLEAGVEASPPSAPATDPRLVAA